MSTLNFQQAYTMAAEHFNAGRLRDAEHVLMQILSQVKDQPDCLHMLGLAQHQLGRGTAGLELIRRAVDLDPNNGQIYANLASLLSQFGQPDEALAAADRAVELSPDLPEGHYGRGTVLRKNGRLDDAIAAYVSALNIRPEFPECQHMLGVVLNESNRSSEAIPLLTHAVKARPNWPEALCALGDALQGQNRYQEAINSYRQALVTKPRYLDAHTNLGHAMRAQNRLEEAMHSYRAALAIDPKAPESTWAAGFIHLLQGDFIPGFQALESRLFHRDKLASFAQPNWQGEPLAGGKRIMLVAEQGLGDTIQFVRYAPIIKAMGAQVAVLCQRELERLLKSCAGIDLVVPDGAGTPKVEYRCAMMSIPRVLRTTLQTIPAQIPYLSAEAALAEVWRDRLKTTPAGLRVGLQWTGDPHHTNNRNRSIPRDMLAALSQVPGVTLFSLQKDQAAGPGMINVADGLTDMADTAALIANLDLVISVDTAVCHLAGAMGKPIWTLISFAPDWRWMLERSDSPWYPTMRLFRQPAIGDWGTPMTQLSKELGQLAQNHAR